MSNSWILYEHSIRTSGDSGIRGKASTKVEPIQSIRKDSTIKIIREGLSYEEATNLMSLTPEICRLTSAVNTIFGQYNYIDGKKDQNLLLFLFNAYKNIIDDRKDREKFNLVPTSDYKDKLVDPFSGNTGKYLIFRKMTTFINVGPDGTVWDLEEAITELAKELTRSALENQILIWNNQEKR